MIIGIEAIMNLEERDIIRLIIFIYIDVYFNYKLLDSNFYWQKYE